VRYDDGVEAPADESGVAVWLADLRRDRGELAIEGAARRGCGRGHVVAERADDEAPEAADRAEAVRVGPRGRDGARRVDLDAERGLREAKRVAGGADDERDVLEGGGALLERLHGLRRRKAADVDAGDRLAVRQRPGGPCVDGRRDQRTADEEGGDRDRQTPQRT